MACFNSCGRNADEPDSEIDDEEEYLDGKETLNVKKSKKVGRKSYWSAEQLDDAVDIIVSSEYYKQKLIFENTKKQKNGQIYGRVLKELKERCNRRGEEMNFSVEQLRSKFKKCVGECKWALMTVKTATGIDNLIDKKGYGAWFKQFHVIVKSRDSCQPERAVEPSASSCTTKLDEISKDSAGNTSVKLFMPVKSQKRKKDESVSEALKLMKTMVDNDPTKDLVNMIQTEMERSREHEMNLMKMIISAGNQQPAPMHVPNTCNTTMIHPASFPLSNVSRYNWQPHSHPHSYPQDLNMLQGHQEYQFHPVSPTAVSRPSSASSSFSGSSTSPVNGETPVYHTT